MSKNNLSKDTMKKLLGVLSEEKTLVGPVLTGKTVEYKEASADEILMDDRISYKSPKEYYFPQVEKIVTFTGDEAVDNTDIKGVVIFGAKPCDLEALRVMKSVFLEGRYKDVFFQRHFDKNILIGVGCIEEKPGCFCKDLGLDKNYSDFCDIMLKDCGDSYVLLYVSKKGRETLNLLEETKALECTNDYKKTDNEAVLSLDTEADDKYYFDMIDWAEATDICQSCGMCTYICPTCHCFEFKDVSEDGNVNRYKCWDSCMYPKFTLHASGHNPRASKHERYRQRVLHKYVYVKKNTGYTACTGCGRCIRSCPAGMNIRNLVESIMEVKV